MARILRDRIVGGELRPGTKVDIEAIASELSVSRTPVREAILQLEGLGLVERQPYRGAVVTGVDPERLSEVAALRIHSEGLAAGFGATRLSDDDVQQMRATLDEIEARGGDEDFSLGVFNELNARFHGILLNATGAPTLIRLVETLTAEADRMRVHSTFDHTSSMLAHREILAACERRDGAAVRELMRQHILEAYFMGDTPHAVTGLLSEVLVDTGMTIEGTIA